MSYFNKQAKTRQDKTREQNVSCISVFTFHFHFVFAQPAILKRKAINSVSNFDSKLWSIAPSMLNVLTTPTNLLSQSHHFLSWSTFHHRERLGVNWLFFRIEFDPQIKILKYSWFYLTKAQSIQLQSNWTATPFLHVANS